MRRHIVSERTACSGNGALLKFLPGLRMKLVTYRLLMLSIGCFACICAAAAAGAGAPALYDRLGGKSGVAAITDALIDRVSSDPVLGRSFKDSNLPRIKRLLAEQICELSGGPCRYSGDSMKEVH